MNKKTIELEVMWAIYNPQCGFYFGTAISRREIIHMHEFDMGLPWKDCRKNGDVAVKVIISAAEPLGKQEKSPFVTPNNGA